MRKFVRDMMHNHADQCAEDRADGEQGDEKTFEAEEEPSEWKTSFKILVR